ncbi:hypothetical protein VP01_3984g1 [Puccinia sorghi]|uniref:Uncharacterized protein n=1 Tax=Puccinia sorghi TaxID=27349 RepID=A0A0L6US96_9BASI|nr:hypothetical protein VP01_3984g1 [Puccinia sorghi]
MFPSQLCVRNEIKGDCNGSAGGATVSVTGGTINGTIPLGSFTLPLPLHAHPEQHQHQNSHGHNEPVYFTGETTIVTSRIGDKHNGNDGLLDDGYYSNNARRMQGDINHTGLDNRHNHSKQASDASNVGVNNSSPAMTTTASNKMKKKNKKKKTRPSLAQPMNPVVPTRAPSQLNPLTRKSCVDPPGVHPANQTLTPNAAAAPASQNPPSTQKRKTTVTNLLSSNINNSISLSTITNSNSNNISHQPTEREQIRVFWMPYGSDLKAKVDKNLPGAYPKPPGPGPFPRSIDIMMTSTHPTTQAPSKKAVPK